MKTFKAVGRLLKKKKTDIENSPAIPIVENSGSQYTSSIYSQVYGDTNGVLWYEAEDGKTFRLIDGDDEVVETIKEAVKLEKAQIKERQLLI